MSVWHICGGERLTGSIRIPGSTTAALYFLAASLMTGCETELTNCPHNRPVDRVLSFLEGLGCVTERSEDVVFADSRVLRVYEPLPEVYEELRSPELFRTALSVRRGERKLGGTFLMESRNPTATACAMLSACGAKERTLLLSGSREPEIRELGQYLRRLGGNVTGAGSSLVTVDGFSPVKRIGARVCPDRRFAAGVLCACACAGGDVEIRGIEPEVLCLVTDILEGMGCETDKNGYLLRCRREGVLRGGKTVVTGDFPRLFPDYVPLLMAAALKAEGRTVFAGGPFPGADALGRFGGDVRIMGSLAVVNGKGELFGASVRGGNENGDALFTAALGAEGMSHITDTPGESERLAELARILSGLGAIINKSEY